MGSFNTSCMVSQQTIVPGAHAVILPISQQATYNPVELTKGDKELSQFGFAHTSCYPTAFWGYAGPMIRGEYDDYGRFELFDTPENKSNLISFFNTLIKDAFTTKQGENQYHDHAFDIHAIYDSKKEHSFEDLVAVWEKVWDVSQENRLFVSNYQGHPRNLQFGVVHQAAADFLIDYVNKSKSYSNQSYEQKPYFNDYLQSYFKRIMDVIGMTAEKKNDKLMFFAIQLGSLSSYRLGEQYGYDKDTETGLFITSSHGSSIENFLKELYKHDKSSGQVLLDSYHQFATTCSDVTSIEEKFIKQLNQLTQYLVKEKIVVTEYDIDYISYSQKPEEEQIEAVDKLYEQYGKGDNFPAYNDLDYTPFMSNGDFYMYDSSGARLYIVKNETDSQKIYMMDRDRQEVEMDDGMNEFTYDHNQSYLLLAKQITPGDLIGEIKDGKIIKASLELTTLDLMQSYIVETLYEEGKIENGVPKLTFEELLENYTLQKEFYQLKERAFLEIFKHLKLSGDTLTYEGFSLMKETAELENLPCNSK